MKRLLLLLAAGAVLPLLWTAQTPAQETDTGEIRIEGFIEETRPWEDPPNFRLRDPAPLLLADGASILNVEGAAFDFSALADLVFDNRNHLRVRITLDDEKRITRLAVVGLDAPVPDDLAEGERAVMLLFVDTDELSVTPSGLPVVEVTKKSLTSRGTKILDEDGETNITIDDLQHGSLVEVIGTPIGESMTAREVRVLQKTRHFGASGAIIKIERESATRGTIKLYDSSAQYVDSRAPVYLGGQHLGDGPDPITELLNKTAEPVVATLSDQNRFEQGWWGRVDLEVGKTAFGAQWQEDTVVFLLPSDPARAVKERGEEHYILFHAKPVIKVDERTVFRDDTTQEGVEVTFDDLTELMGVHVQVEAVGDQVIQVIVSINERPLDIGLTLRVTGRDEFGDQVWFNGPSTELLPSAAFQDLTGAQTDSRRFEQLQWEGQEQYVALVTMGPGSTKGTEVQLVRFEDGVTPSTDQMLIGQIGGIHRGFWLDPEGTSIGTHGMSGVFTPNTVVRTPDGTVVSLMLLDAGIEVEVVGVFVGGQAFLKELTILNEFLPFEITSRIRHIEHQDRKLEFEEPPSIKVAHDAKIIDHFGDSVSLNLLADLLQQGELQLRLTFGEDNEFDGGPAVTEIEAFLSDVKVEVGSNQRLIVGGRIDSWDQRIIPQSVQSVRYSDETQIRDASGNPLGWDDLVEAILIRVVGHSMESHGHSGGPYGQQRIYTAELIEVLGAAATEYRGLLAKVEDGKIIFEAPRPLVLTSHSNINEETGFNIDFLTLAGRIQSEGGLLIQVAADFESQENPHVWWARIIGADEKPPSNLGRDEIVAVFIEADEEARTIHMLPIPPIDLPAGAKITDSLGDELSPEDLIPGARLSVLAESRDGGLIAAEVIVEESPQTFEFTGPVGYIDAHTRWINFEIPPFVSVDADAEILDTNGELIDLDGLRNRLYELQEGFLRITQATDSPTEAPIAVVVEILDPEKPYDLDDNQFFVMIDDPGWRIRVHERRLEPAPIPGMQLAENAEILDSDGQPINLSEVPYGSRIRVSGQDFQGRLVLSELQVVGGHVFVDVGTIAEVDVENRIIKPAPEPPEPVDPNAYIEDPDGERINLDILADYLTREPDLLVAMRSNSWGPGISHIQLIKPDQGRSPDPDEIFAWADEIEVDTVAEQILFKAPPPAEVTEDAEIRGPGDEVLTLADLEPGQRVLVRGEELDGEAVITAITVIPTLDALRILTQIGDYDEGGVDNDVQVNVLDQDDNEIALPVRIYMDHSPPVETRSGHVFDNLPPGPHVVEVEIPSRPNLSDRARVFISARGSAFKVTLTDPASGETGVSQTTDISITFNEPLRLIGDFISVAASLDPQAQSGSLRSHFAELEDDGKTVVFQDVIMAEGANYTLSVTAATSQSSNILAQPLHIQFSTGQVLARLGSLTGSVTLSDKVETFVGDVWLFDENGQEVRKTTLDEHGQFAFNAVFEGTYRLSAEVKADDGREGSGFLDDDGDGHPDDVILASGEIQGGLTFALELAEVQEADEGEGVNVGASVVLDLDETAGNQGMDNLNALPDEELQVAVYATGVEDLIAYNISLTYDSTAVSLLGVVKNTSGEGNFLKANNGLAFTLPPMVTESGVEFAGAILGPTAETAVSGDGLLGVFTFRTHKDFSKAAEFLVPRILLQTRAGEENLSSLGRATVDLAAGRILLEATADPREIPADGTTTSAIVADLRDAVGVPVTEQVTVRFSIVSGDGTLSETEVATSGGMAKAVLSGDTEGKVVVQVNVDGHDATEQVTVTLRSAEEQPDEGKVGPVVLDLDLTSGDNEQRQTTETPESGDTITIEFVAIEGTQGMSGVEAVLEFDGNQLAFENFEPSDVLKGAFAINTPGDDEARVSAVLLGSTTDKDSGTLGLITLTVKSGFEGETTVRLAEASYGYPSGSQALEIGSGGATLTIGGTSTEPSAPSPDFDGSGLVDFLDFLAFAMHYGTSEGDADYDSNFDLSQDSKIDFLDFIAFAGSYGQSVGKPARLTKPAVGLLPGPNGNAGLLLAQAAAQREGEISVVVAVEDAAEVAAYGLRVQYDPSAMELLGAEGLAPSRFTDGGGPALQTSRRSGDVILADALQPGAVVTGGAELLRLRFRTLGDLGSSRVEIVEAMVADVSGRVNELAGVHMADVRTLPAEDELLQNHPNPFNPQTVVPFTMSEASEVRVAIYNLLGQEVAVLVHGHRDAGLHRVVWDGVDLLGRPASSGIYFVRMVTNGFSGVRRMMLLR